jgi:hypothetical protein
MLHSLTSNTFSTILYSNRHLDHLQSILIIHETRLGPNIFLLVECRHAPPAVVIACFAASWLVGFDQEALCY